MPASQAIIETIMFICMLYGAIRFIRDIPEGIFKFILTINSFIKKRRLAKEREKWETIPDGGGTVEGSLEAAKIFADAMFRSRGK